MTRHSSVKPRAEKVIAPTITIKLDGDTLTALAGLMADQIAEQLRPDTPDPSGYLSAQGAADYLGVSRKRIHDLTSMGALEPDGRDGRTPLYRRETLDDYAVSKRS